MDLNKFLETVRKREILSENELRKVLIRILEIFAEEDTVVRFNSPVNIVGDIHGQFGDLKQIFALFGEVKFNNYIFLGDYVSRGFFSVEVITYLFLLKLKYPEKIVLLRGNHEDRCLAMIYGFEDELRRKEYRPRTFTLFCQVFEYMPLCCVVDKEFFLVHGGLSPNLPTITKIKKIPRGSLKFNEGGRSSTFTYCGYRPRDAVEDLLWSSPEEELEKWNVWPKSAGYVFGSKVVEQFCFVNRISVIIRSHQLCQKGYKFYFDNQFLTVFSAPDYCYRCDNDGAIVKVKSSDKKDLKIETFSESEGHKDVKRSGIMGSRPLYFL